MPDEQPQIIKPTTGDNAPTADPPQNLNRPVTVGYEPAATPSVDPVMQPTPAAEATRPGPISIPIQDGNGVPLNPVPAAASEPAVPVTNEPKPAPPIPASDGPLSETTPPAPPVNLGVPQTANAEDLQSKINNHPLFSGAKEPPAKRKRSKKWLVWLLALIVLIVVGGYLAVDSGLVRGASHLPFHIFKQAAPIAQPTISTQQTTNSQSSNTTQDPYSGWQTYTSSSIAGLSFRYPSDWKLTKNAPSLNVDSVDITSPAGTDIYWGSASAGAGGVCDSRDFITLNSVDTISGAPSLYVVQWTTTTYTSGTTTPQTENDLAVVAKAQDDSTPPKTGRYNGCVYPAKFTDKLGKSQVELAVTQASYKVSDLAIDKLILQSLKY